MKNSCVISLAEHPILVLRDGKKMLLVQDDPILEGDKILESNNQLSALSFNNNLEVLLLGNPDLSIQFDENGLPIFDGLENSIFTVVETKAKSDIENDVDKQAEPKNKSELNSAENEEPSEPEQQILISSSIMSPQQIEALFLERYGYQTEVTAGIDSFKSIVSPITALTVDTADFERDNLHNQGVTSNEKNLSTNTDQTQPNINHQPNATPFQEPNQVPHQVPQATPSATPNLTPSLDPSQQTPNQVPQQVPQQTPQATPNLTPSLDSSQQAPNQVPQQVPQQTPQATPNLTPSLDPSQHAPNQVPHQVPQATPSATPNLTPSLDPSQQAPNQVPQQVPQQTPQATPNLTPSLDPSQHAPNQVPHQVPNATPSATPNLTPSLDPSQHVPNQVPQQIPQQTPQATPSLTPNLDPAQQTPNQVPNQVPNATPGATPNLTPNLDPAQQAPNQVPQQVPNQIPNATPGATPNLTPNLDPSQLAPNQVPNQVPNATPGATPNLTPNLDPAQQAPNQVPNQIPNATPGATPNLTPNLDPTQQAPNQVPSQVPNATPGATPIAIPYLFTAASVSGTDSGIVKEDDKLHVTGQLKIVDPDAGQAHFQAGDINGQLGTLHIAKDGKWSYDLDNAQVQSLSENASIMDKLTVMTADGTTHQISLMIAGTNDLPEVKVQSQSTTEDGALVSGTLVATEVDSGDSQTFSSSSSLAGFTLHADGSYTFNPSHSAYQHLAQGEPLVISVPVTVTDSAGAFDTKTLTLQLTGTNDGPVLTPPSIEHAMEGQTIQSQLIASDIDDHDTFSYSLAAPVHGLTLNTDGSYIFNANHSDYNSLAAGQTKVLKIPVTVTDSHGATDTQNIQITVTGTNDGPMMQLVPPRFVKEDIGTIQGQLHATDLDLGDSLTYAASAPVHGFSIKPDGSYLFDATNPAYDKLSPNQQLELKIPVEVTDSQGAKDSQIISITVIGTNDVPRLSAVPMQQVKEDGSQVHGHLASTDADQLDSAIYSATQNIPGFVMHADGSYTFDPANPAYQKLGEGEVQDIKVPVMVMDANGGKDTGEILIRVEGTNDVPKLMAQPGFTVYEGTAVHSGQFAALDLDSKDTLSFSTPNPVKGFILNPDGSYRFDPTDSAYQHLAPGDHVSLSIPVTVSDTHGATATQTLHFTVNGTDNLPVIAATPRQSVTEDQSISGRMLANDPDDKDQLTFSLVAPVDGLTMNSDGSYTFDASNSAYQYLRDGQKLDLSIPVSVSDANGEASLGVLHIGITGANDKAMVLGIDHAMGSVSNAQGGTMHINGHLAVMDIDSGESSFQPQLLSGSYGVLAVDASGKWSYTADAHQPALNALQGQQSLPEHFQIKSADGTTHDIDLTIKGHNTPAIFGGTSTGMTKEDVVGTASGKMVVTDPNAGESGFTPIDHDTAHGHFTLKADGSWTFTLNNQNSDVQHLAESGMITEHITVGSIDGTPHLVAINIIGTNDQPIIGGVATGGLKEDATDTTVSGLLHDSDTDAGAQQTWSVTGSTQGQFGSLAIDSQTGQWTYTIDNSLATTQQLAAGHHGKESFTVQVTDEHGATAMKTVVITVNGSNDAPVISSAVTLPTTTEDTSFTVTEAQLLANASDVDSSDVLRIGSNIVSPNATITGPVNGVYTVQPDANYNGDLTLTYAVEDSNGAMVKETATATITNVNDAPVVSAPVILPTSTEDTSFTVTEAQLLANVTDADTKDVLRIGSNIVSPNATITGPVNGVYTVQPDANYNGDLTLTYAVEDNNGAMVRETATATITNVNDAPIVSAPVTLTTGTEDTSVTLTSAELLANASDVDQGETAQLSVHNLQADHGHVVDNGDGTFSFTPEANYSGDVTFNYEVQDTHGGAVPAHATLNLASVTDTATPSITVMAEQQVMEFAHGSASGVVNTGTINAGGAMHALTIDMTILGGQQVATSAGHGATFISYATSSDSNAMYVWNPDNLTFRVGGNEYQTGVPLESDGHDHRYTFSWDGNAGTLDVLIDGQVAKHLTGVGQGVSLADGGKFALGNDQDNFGGGFSAADAFTGKIFNTAIAKTALPTAQLEKAPLANLLDGDQNLLTDVRVEGGQFRDATGHYSYSTQGTVAVSTVQVDTRIASPNPGATLKLSINAGAPTDSDDQVTGQTLMGLPPGTVISDSHGHSVTATGQTDAVDINGWRLDTLQAVIPSTYHANINISYSVTTTGPDGDAVTTTDNAPIIFDPTLPVPDALIAGDDRAITDEDAAVSGTLTIDDTDSSQESFQAGDINGQYGKLTLQANGHWTYTPDDRADTLAEGTTQKDKISVFSADGSIHQIVVTLTGTNDLPMVSSAVTLASGTEDNTVTLTSAQLLANASDVDQGETAQLSVHNLQADHGNVLDNGDGTYTFTPDANYNGPVSFTYDIQGPQGATVATSASMNLAAVNDAAVISGQDHMTTQEDGITPVRGQLTVIDADTGEAVFTTQMHATGSGGLGHFTVLPTGIWIYSADNSNPKIQALSEHQTLTDTLVVSSADGTHHTITVTIEGTDDAPVITGDTTAAVTEDSGVNAAGDLEASGKLTVTDADAGQNPSFVAKQGVTGNNGYGSFSIDASGQWTYTAANSNLAIQGLKANQQVTDSLEVVTSSGETKTLTVTITGSNDVPTVTAATGHQTATEDTPLIFSEAAVLGMVGAADTDSDTLHVTEMNIDAKYGQFNQRADGSWIFTPNSQISGIDLPVTIKVSDGQAITSAQGLLDISAVADTPTLQVTVDSLSHPSVNSYSSADFSGTGEAVDFDLTASGYQVPGEHQAAGYYAVTTAHGGTADDVFKFSDMQSGQNYHVDGGQGSNVLDLSSYHADDVRIDTAAKTVTVNLADGSTSTISYNNIDQFRFSEQVFDGTPHGLTPVKGQWVAQGAHIESTGGGPMQTSIVNFQGQLAHDYTLAATVNAHHAEAGHQYTNGGIVFDYVDEQNFKVAFLRVGMQSWTIESCKNGHMTTVERVHEPSLTSADTDHHVELHVHGSVAELWSGGTMKASHDFHEPLNDGKFGVVADRAHTAFELEMQPSDWAPSAPNLEILMGATDGSVTTADVLAQAIDPEGHSVTLSSVQTSTPHGGTVVDNGDGTFNYLPAPGFTGQDSFTYQVTDGTNTTTAMVKVNIANIHTVTDTHPGDAFSVNIGTDSVDTSETLTTRIYGLPDGSAVTDGTHSATVSSGDHLDISDWSLASLRVTPPADQTANYLFHVETRSTDGTDTSPWISTPLRVQLQPHSTAYSDATFSGDDIATSIDDDTAVTGTLVVDDPTAAEAHFAAQTDVDGHYGKFSIDADGHWSYIPDDRADALADQTTVKESFVVESADGSMKNVEVTITGSNDSPVVTAADSGSAVSLGAMPENVQITFVQADLLRAVGASDAEGDTLSVSDISIDAQYGSVTQNANGEWVFTPTANFHGDDIPLTISVSDGKTTTQAHATIDITPPATAITIDSLDNALEVQVDSTSGHHVHGSTNPGGHSHWSANAYQTTSGDVTIHGSATGLPDGAPITIHLVDKLNSQNTFDLHATVSGNSWQATIDHTQVNNVGTHDWTVDATATDPGGTTLHATTEIFDEDALTQSLSEGDAATGLDLLNGADGMKVQNLLFSTDGGKTYSSRVPAGYQVAADGHTLQIDPTASNFDSLAQGVQQKVLVKFDITETVGSNQEVVHQTAAVTVTGSNDAATISGAISATTVDDDTAVSGQLTVSDPDAGEDHFTAQTDVNGQYGKFSVDAQGQWTYTPDDRADALDDGNTQQETFTVTSADGTTHDVAITVTGSDEAPAVASGGTTIDVYEGSMPSTDENGDPFTYQEQDIVGQYGTYHVDTSGHFVLTPNPDHIPALQSGTIATESFGADDASGGFRWVTMTDVDVQPGTTDASATPGDAGAGGAAVFEGSMPSTDENGQPITYKEQDIVGQYGTYHVDTSGHFVLTPNPDHIPALQSGTIATESFGADDASGGFRWVTMTDVDVQQGAGGGAPTGATASNDAPSVTATSGQEADLGSTDEDTSKSFTEDELLRLVGASDTDGDTLQVSGVSINAAAGSFAKQSDGSWQFTPSTDFKGDHIPVTIEVSDGKESTTAHAAIDINPVAETPTLSVALGSVPTTTTTSTSTQVVNEVTFANPYFGDTAGYIAAMGLTPNKIAVSGIDPSYIVGVKVNGQDVAILSTHANTPHGSAIAIEIPVTQTQELTLVFAAGAPMTGNLCFHTNSFGNDNDYMSSDFLIDPYHAEAPLNREQTVTTTTQTPDIGEDTVIPLVITAGVSDSSETLSLSVSGLPSGSVLSAGTQNPDGTWTLSPSELSGLQLTPPLDFSGQIDLQVTATSTDGTDQVSTTTPLQIDISPVAETITLSGSDVTIDEDSGVADLSIGLNIQVDPSETQSLSITGLPTGATLSAGVHNADGSWTLTPAQLQGLSVTPADQWSGTMALRVTATSTETTGEQSQDTLDINVHVNPILDMTASAHDAYVTPVNAANGIAFPFDISSVDSDETFSFTVDLPQGWHLLYADGTQHIAGGTIYSSDDFATMKLLPPAGYTGSETVGMHVYAHDGSESHNFDLSSRVSIDPNAPTFSGIDSADVQEDVQVVDEGGAHYLKASGDIDATDPHGHPLTFTPNTVTGSHGGSLTINAHGVWEASIDNSQDAVQNMNTGESFKEVFEVQTASGVSRSIEITVQGTDEVSQGSTQSDENSANADSSFTFKAELTPVSDSGIADDANNQDLAFELPSEEEINLDLGNVSGLIDSQQNSSDTAINDAFKAASTLLDTSQTDSEQMQILQSVEKQDVKEHLSNPDAKADSETESNTETQSDIDAIDYDPDALRGVDNKDSNDGSGLT